MNQFISFFSVDDTGKRNLVGIGITDKIIDHLKSKGGILQEAERNGQGVDLVVIYEPTMDELVNKVKDLTSNAGEIKFKFI